MENNKTVDITACSNLFEQISTLLNLSLPAIRNKYVNYPQCLIEYTDKEITEKSIEIRFDKEEFTLTCAFNTDENCDFAYLFFDKNETLEEFILFLKATYEYDFITSKWIMPNYFIKIRELSRASNDICFMFFHG